MHGGRVFEKDLVSSMVILFCQGKSNAFSSDSEEYPATLRGMGNTGRFSAIFAKGDNFSKFCLLSCTSEKESTLKGKCGGGGGVGDGEGGANSFRLE